MTSSEFRKLALDLPETVEVGHMGHPDFRVGGKIFATLGYPRTGWAMVKLPPEDQAAFVRARPKTFELVKGAWGKAGATYVILRGASRPVVRAALLSAWLARAPKKLARQVDAQPQARGLGTTSTERRVLRGAHRMAAKPRAEGKTKATATTRTEAKTTAKPKPKANAIDEYLAALGADQRSALGKLRSAIRAAAPNAEECISYQLPAFRQSGMLVAFGATASHCAFYLMSSTTVKDHEADLEGYDTSKGTIRFPAAKPLPVSLVRKLVKARIKENERSVARRNRK
jgi:uncharacterized protein YdhG (YjbR/CyaY superfamily)